MIVSYVAVPGSIPGTLYGSLSIVRSNLEHRASVNPEHHVYDLKMKERRKKGRKEEKEKGDKSKRKKE